MPAEQYGQDRESRRTLPTPLSKSAAIGTGPTRASAAANADGVLLQERHRLTIPPWTDKWTLTIGGMVAQELTVTYDDILGMDLVERDITLNCVSNEVGGPYIGSARWTGVPVRALLERVGIDRGVDQILSTSVDGMNISTPVQALLDDREALLVVGMDGRPLPAKHGFPVRLLTPGLYGFVGATKWLERLTATTYAAKPAYWTERDWATDAPVRTQSRIDTPKGLGGLRAGQVAIGGVAWSQAHQGIRRVEVRVDDGPWVEATLGPEVGAAYWRQWSMSWEATPGRHQLTVRATDGEGTVQATAPRPFPSGARACTPSSSSSTEDDPKLGAMTNPRCAAYRTIVNRPPNRDLSWHNRTTRMALVAFALSPLGMVACGSNDTTSSSSPGSLVDGESPELLTDDRVAMATAAPWRTASPSARAARQFPPTARARLPAWRWTRSRPRPETTRSCPRW